MGGPRGRVCWYGKFALSGFDPTNVQPVASSYTDYALSACYDS